MSETALLGVGCYNPQTARDRAMWAKLRAFCDREPRAFERDPSLGHVTGSAFVLSPDRQAVLLTHHAKLNRWLQLGGHCDGLRDVHFVALKEAYEESGLTGIDTLAGGFAPGPYGDTLGYKPGDTSGGRFGCTRVFDVDIHEIPASHREPAHLHYDVRFLFQARDLAYVTSSESHALAWVGLDEMEQYTQSPSVLVLRDKLAAFLKWGR